MRRILTFIILSIALVAPAMGGNIKTKLPKKAEVFLPGALNTDLLTMDTAQKLLDSGNYGQGGASTNRFWVAYSDRSDNALYASPDRGAEKIDALGLGDEVRIAQISGDYALVYDEPSTGELYPKISSTATFKGWIPMSKLLLWSSCPTDNHGIYYKAMICANIDKDLDNPRFGYLFTNPTSNRNAGSLSMDFTFYFVIKREGTMSLLCKQNKLGGPSNRVFYGWVDENSYVAWDQRSCLEPNWEEADFDYFASRGIKTKIYEDRKMTSQAAEIVYRADKTKDSYDPYRYRMPGSKLRFPILSDNTEKAWNISTFSNASNAAINGDDSDINPLLDSELRSLSKINIAIVIDGTKSMGPYYPALKDAIHEFTSYLQDKTLRVGVLIYRDIADGKYVTEMIPMTNPENPKLMSFLQTGGEYGIKSSPSDRTKREALYYGIDQALDSFGFNSKESNIMMVIGDCGDAGDYPEVTQDVIIDKLVEKNVSLLAFQVRNNPSDPDFTIFNNNVSELIRPSMQIKFRSLLDNGASSQKIRVRAQERGNMIEFRSNVNNQDGDLYVGTYNFVSSGEMDADELVTQLRAAVMQIKSTVQMQINLVYNAEKPVDSTLDEPAYKNGFEVNEQDIDGPRLEQLWLRKRLGSRYDDLQKKNATVSFKGYTPRKDKTGREYYKTVIYISQEELAHMLKRLAPLYEVANRKGNDREPYVRAMKGIIQGMIPNITDAEINKMGYTQVMNLVAGLNDMTRSMKGRTVAEVANTQTVNAKEYQDLIQNFRRQYRKLLTIQNSPYDYVRSFNDSKYYWIPLEDIP